MQDCTDDKLIQILESVELGYLVDNWGLDQAADWADILSVGQQQRLGFARLFYHMVRFCACVSVADSVLPTACVLADG